MAVRGGWRPLSGFVKLLIQLVREKSGNFKPMAVATMTLSLCNERETQQ